MGSEVFVESLNLFSEKRTAARSHIIDPALKTILPEQLRPAVSTQAVRAISQLAVLHSPGRFQNG
jgi:hypothetical protein